MFGTTGSSDLVSGLKLDLEVVLYFQIWWGFFYPMFYLIVHQKKKQCIKNIDAFNTFIFPATNYRREAVFRW